MQAVGRYLIECRIGEGAMAVVYRAHDPTIDRVVAIKVLKPELRGDLALVGRFLREARAAGALSHPNIVTIYDVGEVDGIPYIAMELLKGASLDEHLRERGRMDFALVVGIGRQIAGALDYAHGLGVVHRDIKPSNIMLCADRHTAKILDFGIARMMEADRRAGETAVRTQFGQVVGTPRYMSPEQAFGLELDHRSDLFSLGVVLYELITGQTAFAGTSIATLALQITQRDPEPLNRIVSDCPRGLSHIVMKLLAKQPDKRFASGGQVAEALRREQDALNAPRDGGRGLSLQTRLMLVMGSVVAIALVLSIWTVLSRQYGAMEQMALTSGTAMTRFVENNVALRAAENAGLPPTEQDWAPVQAFISGAARDSGLRRIVMADAAGMIQGASDPGLVARRFAAPAGETVVAENGEQRVTWTADGDFRFVRTIRYAGRPFGTVDIVIDSAELEAAASSSRNLLVALGLALLGVVLVLSYAIGRSIAKPVERLRRALADAAAGNRSFRISHKRSDSFGALFDAFNDLAERLDGEIEHDSTGRKTTLEETRVAPSPLIGARPDRLRRRA